MGGWSGGVRCEDAGVRWGAGAFHLNSICSTTWHCLIPTHMRVPPHSPSSPHACSPPLPAHPRCTGGLPRFPLPFHASHHSWARCTTGPVRKSCPAIKTHTGAHEPASTGRCLPVCTARTARLHEVQNSYLLSNPHTMYTRISSLNSVLKKHDRVHQTPIYLLPHICGHTCKKASWQAPVYGDAHAHTCMERRTWKRLLLPGCHFSLSCPPCHVPSSERHTFPSASAWGVCTGEGVRVQGRRGGAREHADSNQSPQRDPRHDSKNDQPCPFPVPVTPTNTHMHTRTRTRTPTRTRAHTRSHRHNLLPAAPPRLTQVGVEASHSAPCGLQLKQGRDAGVVLGEEDVEGEAAVGVGGVCWAGDEGARHVESCCGGAARTARDGGGGGGRFWVRAGGGLWGN